MDTSSVIDWDASFVPIMSGWLPIGAWQMLVTQARHADINGTWYLVSPRINLFDVSRPITLTFEYDLDSEGQAWVDISINGSSWTRLEPGTDGTSLQTGSSQSVEVSLSDYAHSIIQLRWVLIGNQACGDPRVAGDCQNFFVLRNVKVKGGIIDGGRSRMYIADTGNHRIQFFEYDPGGSSSTFEGEFGAYGDGDAQFHLPEDAVVGPDSVVYVPDTGNHRIQFFDKDGTFLGQLGSYGDGEGQFNSPSGVAVSGWFYQDDAFSPPTADHFFLYVADTGNHRIQRFRIDQHDGTPDLQFEDQWGSYGDGDGFFDSPEGIDIDPIRTPDTNEVTPAGIPFPPFAPQTPPWEARVYVADANNHRAQFFDLEGVFKGQFATYGDGDEQFNRPQDVGVGIRLLGIPGLVPPFAPRLVDVYVADTGNHRVEYFLRRDPLQGGDDDHEFMSKFSRYGDSEGLFNSLAGIAIDRRGFPFDPFGFTEVGIAEDVFTADTWNHRFQRFDRP